MLGFRVPTTCGKKTSITTYSGEVSPPPANRTTTQCETGGKTGSKTGGETGSKTGSKTGGETGSKTGGETGSETGGETGSETGSETSHLVKLSLPDISYFFLCYNKSTRVVLIHITYVPLIGIMTVVYIWIHHFESFCRLIEMDEDVVGKRKKQLREYPNPLFVYWLKEWADDAAAKGTKSQYTYKKVNTPNIVHSVTLGWCITN